MSMRFEPLLEMVGNEELTILLEIFDMMNDDFLIDLYTREYQMRLLRGDNPFVEKYVLDKMINIMGVGSRSRLKNSIKTHLTYRPRI